MIPKTWDYIFQRYCHHTSAYYSDSVLQSILHASIDRIEKRHDDLYIFFSFLYENLNSDILTIKQITGYLEEYTDSIGSSASTPLLERLKLLIGTGKKLEIYRVGEIPPFSPSLTTISKSINCEYEFQAMIYPITNHDFYSITGRWPKEAKDNPADPHVFVVYSDNQRRPFNLLESDINAIVELCRQFEENDQYEWDIPTACEWLALAGCEQDPYPWGVEPPTPQRANLRFGGKSKLRPVGVYPLGISSVTGAQDCCGNVHEIVRVGTGGVFPDAFRLAGGCYRTDAKYASCHIFGHFKKNKILMRRNVGLRLVRYLTQDREKRFKALDRFLISVLPQLR